MGNEPTTVATPQPSLRPMQVYAMALISLVAGLAIGFVTRGAWSHPATPQPAAVHPAASAAKPPVPQHMPSLQEMKQMADKQAAPVLDQLKKDPKDSKALAQAGSIYHTTHQFKEAAEYYNKAVEADPNNVTLRIKLASSLYRSGDVDSAIAQLNVGLKHDPRNANALFDLGMIRLQGKQDSKGALDAWQKLLRSNPNLSPDRKEIVQKLVAQVLASQGNQHQAQGERTDDRPKTNAN